MVGRAALLCIRGLQGVRDGVRGAEAGECAAARGGAAALVRRWPVVRVLRFLPTHLCVLFGVLQSLVLGSLLTSSTADLSLACPGHFRHTPQAQMMISAEAGTAVRELDVMHHVWSFPCLVCPNAKTPFSTKAHTELLPCHAPWSPWHRHGYHTSFSGRV